MNSDLLVVASSTTQPLCTDVPVPTDGQPQWGRCSGCGVRVWPSRWIENGVEPERFPFMWAGVECRGGCGGLFAPDGPFPFTVGRWAEVERCDICRRFEHTVSEVPPRCRRGGCLGYLLPVGAIVELVEITGPSHHAKTCGRHACPRDGVGDCFTDYCHPDAAPDCWHTSTGKVTVLDEPTPCERPEEGYVSRIHDDGGGYDLVDRQTWWAPPEVAQRLRKVTA